jgi:2-polyprenyl-6-methoxyphenol hydroxylase-like FAD-dependent oxidoreductase
MMLTTLWRVGWVAATALGTVVLLVGCGSLPVEPAAAPDLRLVSAADLRLPAECEAARGAVYRTRYVVGADGRVSAVAPENGPGCVQDALRRWVESFRYAPVAGPIATTIDWMAVTAQRGG